MRALFITLVMMLAGSVLYAQTVGITTNRTTICPGDDINFSDGTTGGNPFSWSWSFPGGIPNASNAQNPGNVQYNTPGTYTATLTINGPGGPSTTQNITVVECQASSGIYRIPYANGTSVKVTRDHITHSPVPNRIDMVGTGGGPYQIVAAADGIIRWIVDGNTQCCSQVSGCSDCNNYVWIEHPNGEWTKYTHFMTGTVTGANFANLSVGTAVCAGRYLGLEGDVGASSGGGRAASACNAVSSVQTSLDSLNAVRIGNSQDSVRCAQHLHFEAAMPTNMSAPFDTLGGFVNGFNRIPLICDIGDNIFKDDSSYVAAQCQSDACADSLFLDNLTFGLQDVALRQADDFISAQNNFNVQSGANVVLSAGNRIELKDGFSATANSFFRARIGNCNRSPGSIQCGILGSKVSGTSEARVYRRPGAIGQTEFSAYPNPFTTELTLSFTVHEPTMAFASLFSLHGREIARLMDNMELDGNTVNNVNLNVENLPAGTYFCVFRAGEVTQVKKLVKVER